MRNKFIYLALIVGVLTVLSGAYVVGGTHAYSLLQQETSARQKHCGNQASVQICVLTPKDIFSAYYPSYLAAQSPLFNVEYSSSSPLTLFIYVTINGFSQTQMKNVTANTTVQVEHFLPPLLKQGQGLDALTSEVNTSLHVQVTDANKHLYYANDIALQLHSRWLMQWTQQNRLRIAAWVTPNDHAVEDLVTKAKDYLPNQPPPFPIGMVGYKEASSQEVRDEVDAIYDTLRLSYHMKYVQESIPYTGADSNTNTVQDIKLPKEVLKQGSGMCIELTVLLAAAAERIGLHSEIVIIPGHAFLGVAVNEDNSDFEYWDAVDVNNNIGADSANVDADGTYAHHLAQHTIIDTILISDARAVGVGPME